MLYQYLVLGAREQMMIKEDVGERLFVLHETHEVQLDQRSAASRHQGDQHTNFKVEAGGIVKVFQSCSQESGQISLHSMLKASPQKTVIKPAELPCAEPVRQLGNAPVDTLQLIV